MNPYWWATNKKRATTIQDRRFRMTSIELRCFLKKVFFESRWLDIRGGI
jgi:hypothetical protein